MKWFINLKIGKRILVGFIAAAVLTGIAGITGITNVGTIGDAVERISYDEAPVVDAANEMKISLAMGRNAMEEFKGATSTMASHDESVIREIEEAFNKTLSEFDVFADAILEGGKTEAGEVRATDNDKLRRLVEEADRFHNEKFQKATADLFVAGKQLIKQKVIVDQNMEVMESIFDEILADAADVEDVVKGVIATKKKNLSTDAKRILERDVPLTDMAMEIKTTLAVSRIKLEEINQMIDEESIGELQNEYAQTIEDFDLWVTAILEGAVTDEGLVYASTDKEVLSKVKELDLDHAEFQEAADELINGQLEMVRLTTVSNEAMELLDQYGDEVANILDQVEQESAGEMHEAVISADNSRTTANVTLVLVTVVSVIFGLFIGIFISRSITKPMNEITGLAELIALGDLRQEVSIRQKDEIGQLADAFRNMCAGLQVKADVAQSIAEGNLEVDIKVASEADVLGNSMITMRDGLKKSRDELDAMMQETDQVVDIVAGVMESASKKDLTKRIDTEFKGKFANLKVNVNGTIENLDDALNQVGVAVNQVSSASDQIASGSQALAQGSNEQASSLEEVSSSLEEMSSMTKQNSDNANQATKLSGEARSAADKGNQAMQEMIEAIEKIKTSSDETAKIVKTIDDIAFQTNLLALNAAVEAARAGDAGKGFAVVAEEVRNLAQKSAEAAKNTSDMINESVENAAGGVKITEDVAKLLTEIVAGSSKVNDLVSEIDAASKEQADGIEQVNTAVADMNKVTQQNAANSEESASASEEMNSQAAELSTLVGEFALTSNGSVGTQTTQPTAAAPVATRAVGGNGSNGSTKRKTAKKTKVKVKAEEAIPLDDADFGDF